MKSTVPTRSRTPLPRPAAAALRPRRRILGSGIAAWLVSTILLSPLGTPSLWADGGAGGGAGGGAAGAGSIGGFPGGAGGNATTTAGGGGGGGSPAGAGGTGGGGAAGGAGASTPNNPGGNGAAGAAAGDGGGGGGSGTVFFTGTSGGITAGAGTLNLGAGGTGGAGNGSGSGGGGGEGGGLVRLSLLNGPSNISSANTSNGGAGGAGGASATGFGGNGGDGGTLFYAATMTGTLAINTGAVLQAGAGGAGGVGGAGNGAGGRGGDAVFLNGGTISTSGTLTGGNGGVGSTNGVGGFGITGSGLTITNSGAIAGGLSGGGVQANAIQFTGGTNVLTMNTGSTLTGGIGLTGTLEFAQSTDYTLASAITGTGSISKTGTGTLTLTGANNYTGTTTVNDGKLQLQGPTNNTMIRNTLTIGDDVGAADSAVVELLAASQIGDTVAVVVNSDGRFVAFAEGIGALTVKGGSVDMGNIAGLSVTSLEMTGGTVSGAATFSLNGNVTTNANAAVATISAAFLGLQLAERTFDVDANFTGTDLLVSSVMTNGSVKKSGSGVMEVTGANLYTGGTKVTAGELLVNNVTGSGTGTGAVTVSPGAVLGGTGTVSGPITISGGLFNTGAIAPGAQDSQSGSIGTLHGNSVKWQNFGEMQFDLGATGDKLALTGALEKDGPGAYLVSIFDQGITQNHYELVTFASTTFTDADLTFDQLNLLGFFLTLPAGYGGKLTLDGDSLDLWLTAALTGALIQNSAGTPTFADFTVDGAGSTGTQSESNTINSLLLTPGSTLQIFNTLTITSGNVGDTGLGSTAISGGTLYGPNGLFINTNGVMSISSLLQGNVIKSGAGSLILNGLIQGNAQILAGLFGGNATITGNLINSGIVSPGNSPGTIYVGGDYTQTKNGTLRIEIGGRKSGQFDRLVVGGQANLDGHLELIRLNKFNLKRGDKITFLTADRGVNGEFSSISNPFESDTILQPTVVYDDRAVSLEMVRGSFKKYAERWGLTPNERATAEMLDSVSRDDADHKALVYLDQRKLDKLPGDFDRIAPEELSSIFTVTTSGATVQGTNVQRRTDDIRSGSNGFSAAGLAVNGQTPSYSGNIGFRTGAAGPSGDEIRNGKESKEVQAPVEDNRWGAFLTGTGEWVDVSGDGNARGYDITSGGFTLGIDYKVTPNFAIGLAAGYAGTSVDLTDNGRVWVNGGKLGIYGTFFQNPEAAPAPTTSKDSSKDSKEVAPYEPGTTGSFYADFAAFGGYNSYDTKRSGLDGAARGSTEGGELNVLAGIGYDWKIGALTIGPTATFNYTLVGMDGFTEHGSLAPLEIAGRNAESVRSTFGFRASYDWKVGGMVIKPELRASWQHEYGDKSYDISASFANGAGDRFLVNGPELGRDSLLVGAGFAIQLSERCATYFYYDGELGRENYDRHSVTGGVRVAF